MKHWPVKYNVLLLSIVFALQMFFCLSLRAQPLAWRGVMIDVSRHFMPLEDVCRQIDAMEHFGLNKLHLHLTDAAGWRIEIKAYPRLTDTGAWRTVPDWKSWWNGERKYADAKSGFGGYYTQDELRELVSYARARGIEIVPEIEFPAHSEEVVASYPELGFNHAEMDMQNEEVYTFMRRVLEEVCSIFPSTYIHVGGDEAATQHEVQPLGMRRMKEVLDSLGRKMVVWDEALTDEPTDSGMVIMVWRNIDTARKAMQLGHDVILCPGKWCYLDKCQDDPMREPAAAGGYLPIDSVYALPDVTKDETGLPVPYAYHLLGVQANLWTEHIENVPYAEYMLWPRAFAIAELGRHGLSAPRDAMLFRQRALVATRWLRDTLGVNAFDLSHEIGERPERQRPLKCLSTHAPVTYYLPYHEYYKAAGDHTLTDGLLGGWNNTDGRWQGFIRGGMDVGIDLGKIRKIKSIECSFLQSIGPEIFMPYTLEIQLSQDGEKWYSCYECTDIVSDQAEDYKVLGWKSDRRAHTKARYVRVKALVGPRRGWVFCDEIIVR